MAFVNAAVTNDVIKLACDRLVGLPVTEHIIGYALTSLAWVLKRRRARSCYFLWDPTNSHRNFDKQLQIFDNKRLRVLKTFRLCSEGFVLNGFLVPNLAFWGQHFSDKKKISTIFRFFLRPRLEFVHPSYRCNVLLHLSRNISHILLRLKGRGFRGKLISVLRSVTCHMWSHSVIPATRQRWTRSASITARQACTRFTYPERTEGWVDLGVGYIPVCFTCPLTVINSSSNCWCKSNVLTVTPPNHV